MRHTLQLIVLMVSFISIISASQAFGQVQSTWSLDTSTNFQPHEPYYTTCVLGGKIYLLGGQDDPEFTMTDQYAAERFNPVTNSWDSIPNLPEGQGWSTSAAIGSKIYNIGGELTLGLVQIFDTSSNKWSAGPSMPSNRWGLTSVVLNGKIYSIGGENNDSVLSTVEIFDPIANKWTEGTSMSTPRYNLVSCVVNGKIYAIGGWNANTTLDGVEIFDSSTNNWSVGPSMPSIAQSSLTACALDGLIYVMVDSKLEIFDPVKNAWSSGPSIPLLAQLYSNVIGNKIYSVIGNDQLSPSDPNMLIFSPNFLAGVVKQESNSAISLQTYPNPLTQSTKISFTLPESGAAEVTIVNLLGGEVARLFEGEMAAGEHSFEWDASAVAAGTYFCVVHVNGGIQRIPLAVVR